MWIRLRDKITKEIIWSGQFHTENDIEYEASLDRLYVIYFAYIKCFSIVDFFMNTQFERFDHE